MYPEPYKGLSRLFPIIFSLIPPYTNAYASIPPLINFDLQKYSNMHNANALFLASLRSTKTAMCTKEFLSPSQKPKLPTSSKFHLHIAWNDVISCAFLHPTLLNLFTKTKKI
jgi:hypothetical protein